MFRISRENHRLLSLHSRKIINFWDTEVYCVLRKFYFTWSNHGSLVSGNLQLCPKVKFQLIKNSFYLNVNKFVFQSRPSYYFHFFMRSLSHRKWTQMIRVSAILVASKSKRVIIKSSIFIDNKMLKVWKDRVISIQWVFEIIKFLPCASWQRIWLVGLFFEIKMNHPSAHRHFTISKFFWPETRETLAWIRSVWSREGARNQHLLNCFLPCLEEKRLF